MSALPSVLCGLVHQDPEAQRPVMKTFGQVLESADELTLDEQESLVSVL